jgi:chromosome segregation ATPase
MSLKFLSAGSILFSRQILFFVLLILWIIPACRAEKTEKDSQIAELQQDVKQLSEENQKLLKEVQALREEIKPPQVEPISAPETEQPVQEITIEQVKTEVGPVLAEVVDKLKKTAETPRTGNQYGMRIEYDLKNAVYGLMNTQEGLKPAAKVIVKYERFLESAGDSRSYGSGSTIFVFANQEDRWVLQSYE